MTTIEKEKALDVVRQMVADGQVSQEVAEKYFPELKESENERIIQYFKDLAPFDKADELYEKYGFSHKDAISWLEKQGETFTKKDVDDAYLKGVCDTKQELEKQSEISLKERVGKFDDGYKVGFSAAKYNQWKPSSEQMNMLAKVCSTLHITSGENEIMESIYNDLKKLREE